MNERITVDGAFGGIHERIGLYLRQAGLEDASGARRFYVELIGKGQLDKVAIDLKVDVRTLLQALFEQDVKASVEEEREACAKIAYDKSDRVQSNNELGWGMRSIANSIGTAIRDRPTASHSANKENT